MKSILTTNHQLTPNKRSHTSINPFRERSHLILPSCCTFLQWNLFKFTFCQNISGCCGGFQPPRSRRGLPNCEGEQDIVGLSSDWLGAWILKFVTYVYSMCNWFVMYYTHSFLALYITNYFVGALTYLISFWRGHIDWPITNFFRTLCTPH